ncbi:Glucan endo-1,3-beta-glucosidase, basic isoform [Dendrobium catenatum]|uniref:Glucan endo-1,3-beta-glucosidase, basic isoform n=1 Tax=Dendrobium catenatum TaxID=906689 RepID=A0A2I0WW24_9ASPA|nr:Glucan endo-1,3-beta-glucosidase, basic isoform [Dendrobium catenatum]
MWEFRVEEDQKKGVVRRNMGLDVRLCRVNLDIFQPTLRFVKSSESELSLHSCRQRAYLRRSSGDRPPCNEEYTKRLAGRLQGRMKVSTSVSTGVFGASYPPSAGVFSSSVHDTLQPIFSFLASNSAPLLANVYPYFSYLGNPNINLNYALFTSPGTVVTDGPLQYQNLFDAMVDAFFLALEKMGGGNVNLVVSETGWPSDGGGVTTQQNAQTYLSNLINHVNQGRPRSRELTLRPTFSPFFMRT